MTGYVRNDTANNIDEDKLASAADLDGEFDAIVDAFDETTGHAHDGSSAEGSPILVTGPAQEYVSDGSSLSPKTDSTYTLGTDSRRWLNISTDAIDVVASGFTLQHSSDLTKEVTFNLTNITTGTKRTITIPDANTEMLGTNSSQTITNKTIDISSNTVTVDGTEPVGFRDIPFQGTKTSSYTLLTTDRSKLIPIGTSGSIVIPNSTFEAGDVISLFNNTSGSITITCNTSTSYIAGDNTDYSSVTLSQRGLATIVFVDATTCVISGNVA